jgi:hypothetical protein
MREWGNNKVGASGGRVSADLLGGKTKERELNFNLIKKKIRFYPKHKGSVILGIRLKTSMITRKRTYKTWLWGTSSSSIFSSPLFGRTY